MSDATPHVPDSLLFLVESGDVTHSELATFLADMIREHQIRELVQAGIILLTEGRDLVLARLQMWLEDRGALQRTDFRGRFS